MNRKARLIQKARELVGIRSVLVSARVACGLAFLAATSPGCGDGAAGGGGTAGTMGGAGAMGSAGTGTIGSAGNYGAGGMMGAAAATGSAGKTSSAGSNGSAGAAGASGTTGVAGTTGAAGTGAAGMSGGAGTAGPAGAAGTSGGAGAAGAAGPAGTGGGAGAAGVTGAAGTSGGVAGAGGAVQKIARAKIEPLPGGTITGNVVFLEVTGGVEVTYAIENCPPGSHQTHIHEGTGCGSTAQQGMHWGPQRGENIGPTGAIVCDAKMRGSLTYTRPSTNPTTRWTIGDGTVSDILGHPVIIHGLNVNDRQGCGVIELVR